MLGPPEPFTGSSVRARGSHSVARSGIRCRKSVFGASAPGSGQDISEHRVKRGTKYPEAQCRAQTQKRKFLGLKTSMICMKHF
jgi:hypothetical protein